MKEILSSIRRKTGRSKPGLRATSETPTYRVSVDALEYTGPRQGQAIDDAMQAEDRNLLLRAKLKPLPRCPECATAVGEGQRDCHHCGLVLRRSP